MKSKRKNLFYTHNANGIAGKITAMIQERMLDLRSVVLRTGLSKSTLYRLIKQGSFPPPLRLAARAVRWRSEEIDEWLSNRPRSGAPGVREVS